MTKGQKVALRHAANAIDGTRPAGGIKLGAESYVSDATTKDRAGRLFASSYLAQRAGYEPTTQRNAQGYVVSAYGLTQEQVEKLDRVAASTHNLTQRADRVAAFLRRAATQEGYLGLPSRTTTGAVAATL